MSSRSWVGATAGSLTLPGHAKLLGPELLFSRILRMCPTAFILTASGCLVVMPNSFGFNYPAHTSSKAWKQLARIETSSGPNGLLVAATRAVQRLAAAKA
jgi:hypothetical protein